MRIGIMLRTIGDQGGIGVYSRNIVTELLEMDRSNEYVLFYQKKADLDTFSGYRNASQRLVRGSNKAIWDQVAIPVACRREKIDVLFHPKFTVPLLAPCPAVMTVHGADWFIPEEARFYDPLDVMYIRTFMPLYFRKCSTVISVSQLTTDNFNRILRLPPGKVRTVYFGPASHFFRVVDKQRLDAARARYNLPERFILTLTKRDGANRKNLEQILRVYAAYHASDNRPAALVVGGIDSQSFREKHSVPTNGSGADILFPGWLEQADLPAVYSLACLYLYPSNLEAFPIPITEAMACGTPIVTSNVNGLKEIAGDAALLVDPQDTGQIVEAVSRVLADTDLQAELSLRGMERVRNFSWKVCASETLAILEEAACR